MDSWLIGRKISGRFWVFAGLWQSYDSGFLSNCRKVTSVSGILHCDVLRILFDTLPLLLQCDYTIRILTLLIKKKLSLSLTY
jgi:hypothetical protein